MRTYGRQYFDTATATDIVISNGASSDGVSTFALKGNDGIEIASNLLDGAPAIYSTDWQGQQLLYDTPRTNLLLYSQDFSKSTWVSYWNGVTIESGFTAPDGSLTAQKLTTVAQTSTLNGGGILSGGTLTSASVVSVWLRSDVSGLQLKLGVDDYSSQTITLTTQWQRYDVPTPSVWSPEGRLFQIHALSGVPSGGTQFSWYMWGAQTESGSAPTSYIPTTTSQVTVTDYTISGTDITLANPLSGWYSGSTYNYALLQWSGTYYGAVNYQTSIKKWVEVDTDANGYNDAVYLTTLAQVLKLNLNESPFFANYGIPQYQTIMSQVFPDYYVNMTQTQFAQYFASLTVARLQNTSPTYRVQVQTNYGSIIDTTIAA